MNKIFIIIFILVLIGAGTYGFISFVKVTNRGIKALDIYINTTTNEVS